MLLREISLHRRGWGPTTGVAEIDGSRVLDPGPGSPEVVSRSQQVELLGAAIQARHGRCRTVLVFRKFENLSGREIAGRLDLPEHTVDAPLTKALHRCIEFFAAFGATPPK